MAQDLCPFNHKFASELSEPAFSPRSALLGKDASALARTLLVMSPSEFSAAFRGSPMKRAKLRGLKRNSAVVLGNIGSADDVPALVAALSDDESLVRSYAAWALGQLGGSAAVAELRDRLAVEPDEAVRVELASAPDALAATGR